MTIETAPRLPPLTDAELDAEQEAMMAPLRALGDDKVVSRIWVRHPRSLRAFNAFAAHVYNPASSTLPLREREILAMRTAWRCRSNYVWSRHLVIGAGAGLSEAEIEALKQPVEAGTWSERDATLVAAADALLDHFFIPDELWTRLAAQGNEQQCIDAVLTVGMYAMMAMFLNTARAPVDEGFRQDPDLGLSR